MKLTEIKENVYYLPNPVNIGVIRKDGKAVLIDTGLDKGTGRKILKALAAEELQPVAVINTHSHADHCGGNACIKERTEAKVYVPAGEREFVENTYLEPFCFYSGADPVGDLKNKFLMAPPSAVDGVITGGNTVEVAGLELEIISLPGHSLDQAGIVYKGVFFCGDAFIAPAILKKHQMPFNINIKKQKETLQMLAAGREEYDYYLPAHGKQVEPARMREIVQVNLETLEDIASYILSVLSTPGTIDDVLQSVCEHFGYRVTGPYKYYLLKTSLKAFLSYLYNQDKLQTRIENSLLYWERS